MIEKENINQNSLYSDLTEGVKLFKIKTSLLIKLSSFPANSDEQQNFRREIRNFFSKIQIWVSKFENTLQPLEKFERLFQRFFSRIKEQLVSNLLEGGFPSFIRIFLKRNISRISQSSKNRKNIYPLLSLLFFDFPQQYRCIIQKKQKIICEKVHMQRKISLNFNTSKSMERVWLKTSNILRQQQKLIDCLGISDQELRKKFYMGKQEQSGGGHFLFEEIMNRNKEISININEYEKGYREFQIKVQNKFKKTGDNNELSQEKKKKFLEFREGKKLSLQRNIIKQPRLKKIKTNLERLNKTQGQQASPNTVDQKKKKSISSANLEKNSLTNKQQSIGKSVGNILKKNENRNVLQMRRIHFLQSEISFNFPLKKQHHPPKRLNRRNHDIIRRYQEKVKNTHKNFLPYSKNPQIMRSLETMLLEGKRKT